MAWSRETGTRCRAPTCNEMPLQSGKGLSNIGTVTTLYFFNPWQSRTAQNAFVCATKLKPLALKTLATFKTSAVPVAHSIGFNVRHYQTLVIGLKEIQ